MKRCILLSVLLGVLLTGCGLDSMTSTQETTTTTYYVAHSEEASAQLQVELVSGQQVCLWGREQLTDEECEAYDLLEMAAACFDTEPIQVEVAQEQVQRCLLALRIDHPEYFWFDGEATYATTSIPMVGEKRSVTLNYTMTKAQAEALLPQVEQYTAECLGTVSQTQSDYEKILGVYRYLVENTDYVLEVQDQSMICLMTRHQATCAGYSRAFQYLMHQLGIPCTLALGTGENGENHGWNIVRCSGEWYQVDVTWGDPVDENGAPGNSLDYTYFMITDQEIYRDHNLDGDLPVPQCTATQYNYYRQMGRQISGWDSLQYEALLRQAAENGEPWLTVRFDRWEDYQTAIGTLIDQGGIMTVFQNCGLTLMESGVTYTRNDTFLELSVELQKLQ